MTVPGVLDLEITAGASAEALSGKVRDASRVLEDACAKAGVSTPDEAGAAFDERCEATRAVESQAQTEKDSLRDLTYEELSKRLSGLQRAVTDYLAKRVATPAICPDLDSANNESAMAEAMRREAIREWESARESLDTARSVQDGLNSTHRESRVQLDLLSKDVEQARDNLSRAQERLSDGALETAFADAVRAVASEGANVRIAESSLKAKNPERVRVLAETTKGSLSTTQTRREAVFKESTAVLSRLAIRGEEGLHDRLHAAQIVAERLGTNNRSLFRRAAAARCLFETVQQERDTMRRAYVAPLKNKIEQLGRLVFDESFQVDISDDLQVVSRTLNGVTVPFNSLSGGTREQLSLIFRSACSIIVAKFGGAPLILDDALGYTDPERLHLMGAVLATAAKECQIVIFTCTPDRYGNVGEATVVAVG